MKQLLALLMAIVMLLSLCACGGATTVEPTVAETSEAAETTQPTVAVDEEKRLEAIATLKAWAKENGKTFAGVAVYSVDTGNSNCTYNILVQDEVVAVSLRYEKLQNATQSLSVTNSTIFYFSGYKNQIDGQYYAYQTNEVTASGTEIGASGGVNIIPGEFTQDSEIEIIDFEATENNTGAEVTDAFVDTAKDGIHSILEILSDVLEENDVGITLSDLGLINYQIDENRESDIRSGVTIATNDFVSDYYVDEFNSPTDQWCIYSKNLSEGTFNNSATSKAKLTVNVIVDEEYVSFFLYEYGSNTVKNSSSRYVENYNISMKVGDGEKQTMSGVIYAGGDRVVVNSAYRDMVIDALCGTETISFYIEDADRPVTNYLFTVNPSNFAELYAEKS